MPRPLPLLIALSLASPAIAQDADALQWGQERSEAFLAGDLDVLWDDMSAEMQDALGSPDEFAAFQEQVLAEWGGEAEILDESTQSLPMGEAYTRIALWEDFDTPVVMEWSFESDGTIAGFFIQPQAEPADSAFLDYETKADLALPFEGEWYVFWGGRTIEENYHAVDPAQRFALDFVVHEDGQSHSGDPEDLASYHCWGREILAPADGLVVATLDDLPDQPIGETDPDNPAGNHVILAIAEDEYAFLAHLQQTSVRVQMGDEVSQGDVLGLCGNSGNTSEPHLHLHLQTTPDLLNGEGLPAQFLDYEADGTPTDRGEPTRGQTISPR